MIIVLIADCNKSSCDASHHFFSELTELFFGTASQIECDNCTETITNMTHSTLKG